MPPLVVAALVVGGVVAAGCTADVANGLGAPLQAIPKTDVVVETNIQSVQQAAQATLEVSQSFAGFGSTGAGGTEVTSGPSTSAGQISYAVAPGDEGVVLVGWNHTDQHCVGTVYIHQPLTSPVLGETAAGQYDFVAPAPTSAQCYAATFVATPGAPSGWPESPSATGWPPG
jgi:hypothetical protein